MADIHDVRAAADAKIQAEENLKTVMIDAFRGGVSAAAIARAANIDASTVRRYIKNADNK